MWARLRCVLAISVKRGETREQRITPSVLENPVSESVPLSFLTISTLGVWVVVEMRGSHRAENRESKFRKTMRCN